MSPADSEPLSALEMALAVEEEFCLAIQFDPAYTSDFHSRVAESLLSISYKVNTTFFPLLFLIQLTDGIFLVTHT